MDMTRQEMQQLQALPYDLKIRRAEQRAKEFYNSVDNCHVSVGGLDSITLLMFLRQIGIDVPAISVSSLEDRSIIKIHKELGVINVRPLKSKKQVIDELGFPVISKGKARKISILQQPNSEKQTFIHAIMTGDMGEQGHWQHSDKIKLPDKWLELFAGNYQEHRPDLVCKCAPFPVSADCCYWMKELPCDQWAKEQSLLSEYAWIEKHAIIKTCLSFLRKLSK